jgi:cation-transporting ATPase 13A1
MSLGQRVLAIGYRKLGSKDSISVWKKRGRKQVECNLTFAGFIVLDCPIKPDTKKVIKELRKSGHHTVMITGDAVLTAAEVARQVGIIKAKANKDTYELRQMKEPQSLQQDDQFNARFAFVPIKSIDANNLDTEKCIAYSASNLQVVNEMLETSSIAAVCVTGETLTKIATEAVRKKMDSDSLNHSSIDPKTVLLHPDAQSTLQALVPLISVFARHAPRQKEAVVAAFNGAGRITLMCGDGTNDVGALKMSHCGISIISVPDVEAKQRDAIDGLTQVQEQKKRKKKRSRHQKKTWEEHLQALAEAEEELNNVALGDASVASPFTSRATSIKCTKDVLQRGRCTLVTMTQIYKILGVNCLVNALVLSSLHLIGAKQGDSQLTVVGVVVAGLFFFVTKGEPLSKLSHHRPPSSVLCKQVLVSIALQFFIHFICIMAVTSLSKFYLDPYDPSLVPDGAFNPNTLNSATFIMTVLVTVNTFTVNYRGRPYMQDLRENKMMMKSLQVCYIALFGCALEVFPPINDLMQLAPLPADGDAIVGDMSSDHAGLFLRLLILAGEGIGFKLTLCALMVLDTVVCIACEKALVNFFEPNVF